MLYHIISNEDTKILKIANIGFSEDKKICRFGPGKRNLYLIHYVLSGKGVFNGEAVKQGQGFLITPNMKECYFPDKKDPWKLLWITLRESKAEEIFSAYNADEKTKIFSFDYVKQAEELTNFIRKNYNRIYSATQILEIFLKLFNNQKKLELSAESPADIYFDYALGYISSNFFRPIKVNDLTRLLGISQPYLYRIFMQKLNISPKVYIDNFKLKKAKELLLTEKNMKISEIAEFVGIDDPLSFSKFFKRNIGISPTEYRCKKST